MKNISLPKTIIKQWPEILQDIEVITIPIQYTHSLKIFFKAGNVWDVDIASRLNKNDIQSLTSNIKELLEIYKSTIDSVDFQLDVERLRKDSIKVTNKFFKIKK